MMLKIRGEDANALISALVYVPKHTSWLNQIECWFSILVRRLLKRSSFRSTEELEQKIRDFIDYFNQHFAKPFVWKFMRIRHRCI
jgi:putative transposase